MRKYDDEYKQQAVKKILDGQAVARVSRELSVAESLLPKWKRAKLETSSDLEKEVLELKKRLRKVEQKRDILKRRLLSKAVEVKPLQVHCQSKKVSFRSNCYAGC